MKPTISGSGYDLYLGDALEYLRALPDGCVSAIITDPPYATTALKWDVALDWVALWPELWRVCNSPKSPVVLFSAQPFTTDLICSQRSAFRYEIIWEKTMPTRFLDANRRPLCNHENILVFSQKGYGNYEAQKDGGFDSYKKPPSTKTDLYGAHLSLGSQGSNERHPKSVWQFSNGLQSGEHPTQKPTPLLEKLVKSYSSEGDTVLDFTFGSGTTGLACLKTERKFIGIERDPDYFAVAVSRLEAATGTFAPKPDHEFGGMFAEETI